MASNLADVGVHGNKVAHRGGASHDSCTGKDEDERHGHANDELLCAVQHVQACLQWGGHGKQHAAHNAVSL